LNVSGSVKDEPDTGMTLLSKLDNDSPLATENFNAPYGSTDASRYHEGLTSAAAAVGQNSNQAAQPTAEYYAAIYNRPVAAVPSTISPSTLLPPRTPGITQKMEHASTSPTPSAANSAHSAGSNNASSAHNEMSEHHDPRKKYKCTACPRGNTTPLPPVIVAVCLRVFLSYSFRSCLQPEDAPADA
jgi:hypothetical protein